jgi:bacteriocin-like protein
MTTPDQTPDTALEAQELTEKNLEEVSGGEASPKANGNAETERYVPMRIGGQGGDG